MSDRTALYDVPSGASLWAVRVGHVWAGLVRHGYGIEDDEDGVQYRRNNRRQDMQHVHGAFDEHEKHRQHGDDKIVIGDAVLKLDQVTASGCEDSQLRPDLWRFVRPVIRRGVQAS